MTAHRVSLNIVALTNFEPYLGSEGRMGGIFAKITARHSGEGTIVQSYEAPALLVGLAIVFVIVIGLTAGIVDCNLAQLAGIFGDIALIWLGGAAAAIFGMTRLGHFARLAAVFILLLVSTAWASDVLVIAGFPLADATLAVADARLFGGFDWPAMVAVVRPHTNTLTLLSYAYASLDWQPILLLTVLCCIYEQQFAWRFLSAWAGSLGLCLLVLPFFPAVGGYVHFHIPYESMPGVEVLSAWKSPELLIKLHSGEVSTLNFDSLNGIITMPSFHAASAVLLAWGYGQIKWLRWPFLALNIVMLVSAVPIGGHYLVDIVAGVAVACLSIFLTTSLTRRHRATQAKARSIEHS